MGGGVQGLLLKSVAASSETHLWSVQGKEAEARKQEGAAGASCQRLGDQAGADPTHPDTRASPARRRPSGLGSSGGHTWPASRATPKALPNLTMSGLLPVPGMLFPTFSKTQHQGHLFGEASPDCPLDTHTHLQVG